ncbi:MAG: 4-hydroxythreonine-4-phosphate dehydrogenase PdxA [Endomicrobium sp.]|jgi:4-hydroxythreonine-4-phosphate dehydrogenase|nr:4-hydroxythreonine-4-phosphate dehydrogenase PdxA [Endomicrobium sp.]
MSKPRIAITLGDPAGIGPEIVCRAVNSLKVQRVCSPVVFGDTQTLNEYFKAGKNCELIASSFINKKIVCGKPSAVGGKAALGAIEKAVKYCMSGNAKALVTAPVSKESLKLAGVKYPGHTELLAALTKSKEAAMMMVCANICGVMVTRHIPLSTAHLNIKTKNIVKTVKLAHSFFKKRGKKNIKTVLCALNPHAGDNGILGGEEKKYILPAYEILKKEGINISKPQPADSAWLKVKNGEYDLICAMYHDQMMIPLKCIDANKIVNVTAGLPFVRTSPGHGTAYDIAGKGKALPDSMIEAILYAAK